MKAYKDAAGRKLIGEQAAQWVCDLREGGETVRESFYGWLKQSPQHVEEFLLATSVWKALDDVGPSDEAGIEQAVAEARASERTANVVPLTAEESSHTLPLPPASQRREGKSFKLAAAFAALALSGAVAWSLMRDAATYTTTTGEQRTVTLADGSLVYLNAESRVKTQYSGQVRRVRLLEGEALFVVAPEAARPFLVTAGAATIQAIGTQFNVRRRENGAKVSVVEGRVRVTTPVLEENGGGTLAAGEEAQVTAQGQIVKNTAPEVAVAIAWRERRLVFRGETLTEVAAEFNRYSQRPLRIEGISARGKRLAGTFNADDPQSLVLFLEKYPDLSVETTADEFVIRGR